MSKIRDKAPPAHHQGALDRAKGLPESPFAACQSGRTPLDKQQYRLHKRQYPLDKRQTPLDKRQTPLDKRQRSFG